MSQDVRVVIGVVASFSVAITIAGVVLALVFRKKQPKKTLIDNNTNVTLRLVDRTFITHDTILLKIALPSPDHVLGLPLGNHVYLSAKIGGSLVVRPYTPVSMVDQKGYVDFIVKVYKAGVNPNFPQGGKMSQYLNNIPVDHSIDIRGPSGNLEYMGSGLFHIKPDSKGTPKPYTATKVSMICGGTGITPMYQLIRHILKSKDDVTKLSLISANVTEKDIILRDELDDFKAKHSAQFKVWYTVNEAPDNWPYSTGYVDEKMIQEHAYPPGEDSLVLLCGPPAMIELACLKNLANLGYSRDRIFIY